jgi:hypothetical protein
MTEYYVATDGDDGHPGTLAEPWLTIDYAQSQLVPGDILYVRGGIYPETVTMDVSGTAITPITIKAYPGETAIRRYGMFLCHRERD